MPELRWILTVFGVLLLVGIYAWGRRGSKAATASDDTVPRVRPEPSFETVSAYEPPRFESEPAGYVEDETADQEPAYERRSSNLHARADTDEVSDEETIEASSVPRSLREPRAARIEPTFTEESITAELPVREELTREQPAPKTPSRPTVQVAGPGDAPTLSMSNTPTPRRIERRKIIALRLAAGPQRIQGAQLKAAFESESLQHGKYEVFHRLDDEGHAMFSIASMVEPGTFNLEKMPQETFPGITMFTQLPGPVAGMLAFNELIACSRRLHSALGGTLQDERGVPLTVHRVERIRQEIRDFELRPAADSQRSNPAYSSSPE